MTLSPTAPSVVYPWETPPAPGAAIPVAPGIFWIRMPLPFALDHINLWLLEDGDGWTIVDTGYGIDDTHALWRTHFADTMGGRPVKRIIVTHYHPDHVGCAAWLHAKTGAPVHMTAAEFLSAHAAAQDFAGFDRANTAELFVRHGLKRVRPDFGDSQSERAASYKRGVPSVPPQYCRLMDGDRIDIGQRTWRLFTTFGHAPEHACLFAESGAVLISGDQVLPRITTNVGVWGNQPDADPLLLFLNSLEKFRPLPADTLVLPSHDRPFRGLHIRLDQLAAHHEERLAKLEAALDTPRCAADVLPILFTRRLDSHQLAFAVGETIAHLNRLLAAGRVTRRVADDGVFEFVRS